jgi:hypothetical protein
MLMRGKMTGASTSSQSEYCFELKRGLSHAVYLPLDAMMWLDPRVDRAHEHQRGAC